MSDAIGDRLAMTLPDGREISLLAPDPALIELRDVALGLSRQFRWGGFGRRCITVAEHCVMAAQAAIRWDLGYTVAAKALLHDAHEFLVRDVSPGMKRVLPEYEVLAGRVQEAVERAFGVEPPTAEEARAIKEIDEALRLKEVREGYGPQVDLGLGDVCLEGLPAIIGFQPEGAAEAFVELAGILGVGRRGPGGSVRVILDKRRFV